MKKSMAAVAGLVLLAAGYVGGAYIGIPFVERNQMEGSIGKAKAHNETSDPEVLAAMEQLASDTTVQKQAVASAVVLSARISQMDDLTKQTIEATKDVKGLEGVNEGMQKLYVRTQNARTAYDKFMEESAKVIQGEKSEAYEQAANEALLAFTVLENNLSACPQFIDAFADYLRENKNEAVDKVAVEWIQYCAEDAVLNDKKEEIDAWQETYKNVANANINLGKAQKLGNFPTIDTTIDKMQKVQVCPGLKIVLSNNSRLGAIVNPTILRAQMLLLGRSVPQAVIATGVLGNKGRMFGNTSVLGLATKTSFLVIGSIPNINNVTKY